WRRRAQVPADARGGDLWLLSPAPVGFADANRPTDAGAARGGQLSVRRTRDPALDSPAAERGMPGHAGRALLHAGRSRCQHRGDPRFSTREVKLATDGGSASAKGHAHRSAMAGMAARDSGRAVY